MIALFKHSSSIMGSQFSVRAGGVNQLAYQIFFRDGLKMLLDQGYNTKNKKIKAQFEYAESVYQAQCDGTLTLDMIKEFEFQTDLGGFSCLFFATNGEEIEALCQYILELTENRRKVNALAEKDVGSVIDLLMQAKSGETQYIIDEINKIHHIL